MVFYIVMYLLSLFLVCDIGFPKVEEVSAPEEGTQGVSVEPSESVIVEDF